MQRRLTPGRWNITFTASYCCYVLLLLLHFMPLIAYNIVFVRNLISYTEEEEEEEEVTPCTSVKTSRGITELSILHQHFIEATLPQSIVTPAHLLMSAWSTWRASVTLFEETGDTGYTFPFSPLSSPHYYTQGYLSPPITTLHPRHYHYHTIQCILLPLSLFLTLLYDRKTQNGRET